MFPPSYRVFYGVCSGVDMDGGGASGSGNTTIVLHPKFSSSHFFPSQPEFMPLPAFWFVLVQFSKLA